MLGEKRRAVATTTTPKIINQVHSYQLIYLSSSGQKLKFGDDVKERWIVKRDECFDEYIALNGRNALGKGGMDHLYLISEKCVGLWVTAKYIKQKITALREKVSSLLVEQIGEDEAILSVPIGSLHALCKAARARKHKHLSESQLQRLKDSISHVRSKKTLVKTRSKAPKIEKLQQ